MSVFARLTAFLDERHVPYDVLRHEPVFTSEEAARVRGTSLSSGAKALICKADDTFVMFVLPANLRLASKAIRKATGLKSLRFADRDEVLQLTGLTPGSIPPFGSLFGLRTRCDQRLAQEPRINFNAGDHAISLNLAWSDYVVAEQPELGDFAEA